MQKKLGKIIFFSILKVTDENSRTRKSVIRIRGSGSNENVPDPQHWTFFDPTWLILQLLVHIAHALVRYALVLQWKKCMHEGMNTEAWIIDRYVLIPSLIPQNISISEWVENE
jgi:hypothetical protein